MAVAWETAALPVVAADFATSVVHAVVDLVVYSGSARANCAPFEDSLPDCRRIWQVALEQQVSHVQR